MSSSPTRDQLTSVLDTLATRLAALEQVMALFPMASPPVASIGHTNVPDDFYQPPTNKKKGKGKAAPLLRSISQIQLRLYLCLRRSADA